MQRIIGIDFGTSTTYMNVKRYNGDQPIEDRFSYLPVVFNYGESSGFVASVVRENADGSFDFGEKAEKQLDGAEIYKEIKMSLESPDEHKRSEARRITKEFFKYLYETYTQQAASFGGTDDIEETIISYPVKWQTETTRFMIEAAQEAGFQNVHGMDEASAAVMAVLCQNANSNLISADKSGYLMMIDMGAGTTDLVVCKYQSNKSGDVRVELVSSWPDTSDEPSFGGREIDAVLEKYVENYLAKALNPALAPQAHIIASTPGQAKMWKERNVSISLAANKQVNTCAYIGTYKIMGMLNGDFTAFGRAEFEKMAESGLRDYVSLLLGCLMSTGIKDPKFKSDGLDFVVLTGGHSAWYFAREIIDGTMAGYLEHPALSLIRKEKDRVVNLPNPQTTVSLGLVYSKLPYRLTKDTHVPENIYKESSPDDAREVHTTDKPQRSETSQQEKNEMPNLRTAPYKEAVNSNGKNFCMFIEDTFTITGRGLVVTGKINSGRVDAGDDVVLLDNGEIVGNTKIMSIERDGLVIHTASAGDDVGLLLPLECEESVYEDMIMYSPDMISEIAKEEHCSQNRQITAANSASAQTVYDSSICPKCGAHIPEKAKKCPVCSRSKLRSLTLPYKISTVAWYKGDTGFGISKATGTLTIYEDKIEYKKHFGNAFGAAIPVYNIYSTIKANTEPKEIFWIKDIVNVKERKYGVGIPAFVITMRDGNSYTFVASRNSTKNIDIIKGAVALIGKLINE